MLLFKLCSLSLMERLALPSACSRLTSGSQP